MFPTAYFIKENESLPPKIIVIASHFEDCIPVQVLLFAITFQITEAEKPLCRTIGHFIDERPEIHTG